MATTDGIKQMNIGFPEAKAQQLEHLAKGPLYKGSKSKLLEDAFDRFLEAQAGDMALAGVQQQLSSILAAIERGTPAPTGPGLSDCHLGWLTERLQDLSTKLGGVDSELSRIRTVLATLEPQVTPPAAGAGSLRERLSRWWTSVQTPVG